MNTVMSIFFKELKVMSIDYWNLCLYISRNVFLFHI